MGVTWTIGLSQVASGENDMTPLCSICNPPSSAVTNRLIGYWKVDTRWFCDRHARAYDARMSLRAPAAGPGVFRALLEEGCRRVREAEAARNHGKDVVNA